MVGINRRTGTRWRHGREITSSSGRRLHYPPVITTRKAEISDRYLSEDERVRIADLHRGGHTVRSIATELGRSPSTISRELRRNADSEDGQYRPFSAQRLAVERRTRPGRGKLINDEVLREFVAARLNKAGVRSRSATRWPRSFPTSPSGTWYRRRSTRRFTGRSWVVLAGSSPRHCAPAGGAATRIAARSSAARRSWWT